MSKFRFGCGEKISVYVPRGYDYREVKVPCGSTASDGGVNQCEECYGRYSTLKPHEGESDLDWFERNSLSEEVHND